MSWIPRGIRPDWRPETACIDAKLGYEKIAAAASTAAATAKNTMKRQFGEVRMHRFAKPAILWNPCNPVVGAHENTFSGKSLKTVSFVFSHQKMNE